MNIAFFALIGFMMFLALWERLEDRKNKVPDYAHHFATVTVNKDTYPVGVMIPLDENYRVEFILIEETDSTHRVYGMITGPNTNLSNEYVGIVGYENGKTK